MQSNFCMRKVFFTNTVEDQVLLEPTNFYLKNSSTAPCVTYHEIIRINTIICIQINILPILIYNLLL